MPLCIFAERLEREILGQFKISDTGYNQDVENHLGKSDMLYSPQCAICLETELFPDSIHYPLFPNSVLRPGDKWIHQTSYVFYAR